MGLSVKLLLVVACVRTLTLEGRAQNSAARPGGASSQASQPIAQPTGNSVETMASELGLLRKSVQTLNARLREISDKLPAPDARPGDLPREQAARISLHLELLSRAEQRAEALRKQLLELTEKETTLRSRLVQIEEDIRPESIERTTTLSGSTRTPELRETRRRVLETERRGYENLLAQTAQSRIRLEEDVRQADALVSKRRLRVSIPIRKGSS
jgi:chromosome segregation ATPase